MYFLPVTSDGGDWVTGVRRAAGCFSEELRAAAATVLRQRSPLPSVPPLFPRLIHPLIGTLVLSGAAHAGPTWNSLTRAHGPQLHTSEWIFIYNAGLGNSWSIHLA